MLEPDQDLEKTPQELSDEDEVKPEEIQETEAQESDQSEEEAPPNKYLGLFDDEVEALATFKHLQDRVLAAETEKRQIQEQEQRQRAAGQAQDFQKAATEHWRKLIQEGRGDEAFAFMQDHTLRQAAMIADQIVNQKLGALSEFERGKQMFLQDKSVADVHENVDEIAALIQQGWSEDHAVRLVRSIKSRGGEKPPKEKVEAAKRKVRDQSYMEESTKGRSKYSKDDEDKYVDGMLEILGI